MAGVGAIVSEVEIADEAVLAGLRRLRDAGGDASPAWDEVGNYMVNRTLERFERGVAPGGVPWTPNALSTVREKGHNKPLIGDLSKGGGRLMRSITHAYGPNSAAFGTDVIYGRIHQLGGMTGRGHRTPIPARPYLGVDATDEAEIAAILVKFLQRRTGEGNAAP